MLQALRDPFRQFRRYLGGGLKTSYREELHAVFDRVVRLRALQKLIQQSNALSRIAYPGGKNNHFAPLVFVSNRSEKRNMIPFYDF